jgi:ankyrin repeat protein
MKECNKIDRLSRLWPDEAASGAEYIWSTSLSSFGDPVTENAWGEIKENINQGGIVGSGYGYTLLHVFAKIGNVRAISLLLSKSADINARSKLSRYTALHVAIKSNNPSAVALLIEHGASPLAPDASGMTAWGLAVSCGNLEIVKSFLAMDAIDVKNVARQGEQSARPLMLAVEHAKEQVVELLVDKGAEIEAMDRDGNTALIKAAGDKRGVPTVQVLLERGANVHAKNHHGLTPLLAAVRCGSEEAVRLLLEKTPDIEARTDDDETALLVASKKGFKSIVAMLLKADAECVEGYTPGHTPQDVASEFEIIDELQRMRESKKRWYQRLHKDRLDEKFEIARLQTSLEIYRQQEIEARRNFSFVPVPQAPETRRQWGRQARGSTRQEGGRQ